MLFVGIVTFACCSTCSAYLPHGAVVAQRATTPALARSGSALMPLGFPGFVAISNWFLANIFGVADTRFAVVSLPMFFVSADANTSAGAPPWICVTNAADESKLNVTFAPGFAASKSFPTCANALLSDAAAETVIVPVTFAVAAEVDAAVVVAFDELSSDDPHPAS